MDIRFTCAVRPDQWLMPCAVKQETWAGNAVNKTVPLFSPVAKGMVWSCVVPLGSESRISAFRLPAGRAPWPVLAGSMPGNCLGQCWQAEAGACQETFCQFVPQLQGSGACPGPVGHQWALVPHQALALSAKAGFWEIGAHTRPTAFP